MSEEISTKNGFLHLSNDENPREGPAEAKVEGERSFAIRTVRSVVHWVSLSDECQQRPGPS